MAAAMFALISMYMCSNISLYTWALSIAEEDHDLGVCLCHVCNTRRYYSRILRIDVNTSYFW